MARQINTTNKPDLKNTIINRWMDEGVPEDIAYILYETKYNELAYIETPDRYDLHIEDNLHQQVWGMLHFGSTLQQYVVKLCKTKKHRAKTKSQRTGRPSKKFLNAILKEMRGRHSRFKSVRFLKAHVSDSWLLETVAYAITNTSLYLRKMITQAELSKRCFCIIFKEKKETPTHANFKANVITIPNIDGTTPIDIEIPELITRQKKIRNVRIHHDGVKEFGLTLCVHHKDFNPNDEHNHQLKIARAMGTDTIQMLEDIKEANTAKEEESNEPKTNIVELFGKDSA